MRIRRLDLIRYGKFTDTAIDFGEKVEGKPDLHIVYGPNEAGKSTSFAAFLDLLFGIERTSKYNFLHAYPTMRIGGTLDFRTGRRDFLRIKRPQNSLLDAREQPVPDNAILGDLGNIDREAYRTMFSLDDETLEAGGESILASRGELGQMLFSASSGLSTLSNRLVELRGVTDAFYKLRARSGELASLKERISQLKAERAEIDTFAADYAALVANVKQATSLYDETISERARIQLRVDSIRRYLTVMPRLGGLRHLRAQIEPLSCLPQAPDGWREQLPDLLREEIEFAVRGEAIRSQIDRIEADIAAMTVDEATLAQKAEIERLAEPRARYITAEEDLPNRRLALRELETVISGLLRRIERSDETQPQRLIPPASVVGELRALMESHSGIDFALKAAEEEWADAGAEFERATGALSAANDGREVDQASAMPALANALAAARAVDFTGRAASARKALVIEQERLAARLAALTPWTGSADELAGLQVPDAETIARLKAGLDDAEKQHTRRSEDVERLTTEVLLLQAELDVAMQGGGLVTDQQAVEARMARETAWAAHRRSLAVESADAFEMALRHDDIVGDNRLANSTARATFTTLQQTAAAKQAELQRSNVLLERAEQSLDAMRAKIAALIASTSSGLDASMSLSQLEAWLMKRGGAIEAIDARRAAERDACEADTAEKTQRTRLAAALQAVGMSAADQPLETLMASAQAIIDRETAVATARSGLDSARRELEARERKLEKARGEHALWSASWQAACAACWLGEQGKSPALAAVREILLVLQELGPALEKRAGLADRIAKMEKDKADFHATVSGVGANLDIEASQDILQRVQMLNDGLQSALAGRNARTDAERRRDKARDEQRALQEAILLHERRREEIVAFFGVSSLKEAAERLQQIGTRKELMEQASRAEREIIDGLRVTDIEAAEAALDAADREALETELLALEPRLGDLDQRCHELYAKKSQAADALQRVGGDARVAAIEEKRRTALLEIEDGATRYLKLRLGIAAAEHALRIYREQHRSSMMSKASDAFRIISRGAYSGLATQSEKDKETLIAVSSTGGSKEAADLSKGTRFQLYLALRVAGYHEFVDRSGPVPFIADDIMETFDDFRAEEAFRLFSGMAEVGQVIYLTHHRHLCDIAKAACPGAHVHEIGVSS